MTEKRSIILFMRIFVDDSSLKKERRHDETLGHINTVQGETEQINDCPQLLFFVLV